MCELGARTAVVTADVDAVGAPSDKFSLVALLVPRRVLRRVGSWVLPAATPSPDPSPDTSDPPDTALDPLNSLLVPAFFPPDLPDLPAGFFPDVPAAPSPSPS